MAAFAGWFMLAALASGTCLYVAGDLNGAIKFAAAWVALSTFLLVACLLINGGRWVS